MITLIIKTLLLQKTITTTKYFFSKLVQYAKYVIKNGILPETTDSRGGSRTAAISMMECLAIIVNGWKPLTIITKRSILDVAAALDPPLDSAIF